MSRGNVAVVQRAQTHRNSQAVGNGKDEVEPCREGKEAGRLEASEAGAFVRSYYDSVLK